jgi:uncharacterized protein YuzE
MAVANIEEYLKLIPAVRHAPQGYLWSSYDKEADTLYINFKKPSIATDSELTDDDVIIRYEGKEVVGLTILHASKRRPAAARGKTGVKG